MVKVVFRLAVLLRFHSNAKSCFFTGVVLMEIAEAHKKVHSELEENVSHDKNNGILCFYYN